MRALAQVASMMAATASLTGVLAAAAEPNPIYMYVDEWTPSPQDLVKEFVRMSQAGVSHIMMAFHLEGNPGFPSSVADTVAIWQKLSQQERDDAIKLLHTLGTKILISSGGESEGDYWLRQDPELYAAKVCPLVRSLGADGIDFDKEGFAWTNKAVMDWTNKATRKCREIWPEAIITSAPQSPHLIPQGDGGRYTDGILSGAGHDHYLVQYYNQGSWTQDTAYEGLIMGDGKGAVMETIKAYGGLLKPGQLVIGKPFARNHAGSGFVEHTKLREILCRAYEEVGYRGGLMFWKLPYGQDLSSVTMLAAPCSDKPAASTPPPVVPTTPAPTTPATTPTTLSTTPPRLPETSVPSMASVATTTATPSSTTSRSVTGTQAPGGVVDQCRALVGACSQYESFDETCKSYCADYAAGGSLTPWCQDNDTAAKVANCVISQRLFCQLKN